MLFFNYTLSLLKWDKLFKATVLPLLHWGWRQKWEVCLSLYPVTGKVLSLLSSMRRSVGHCPSNRVTFMITVPACTVIPKVRAVRQNLGLNWGPDTRPSNNMHEPDRGNLKKTPGEFHVFMGVTGQLRGQGSVTSDAKKIQASPTLALRPPNSCLLPLCLQSPSPIESTSTKFYSCFSPSSRPWFHFSSSHCVMYYVR